MKVEEAPLYLLANVSATVATQTTIAIATFSVLMRRAALLLYKS